MNDCKACSTCKQVKPVSEFYPRGKGSGYYTGECKVCMKLRSRNQKRVDRKVSTIETENLVIAELAKRGIPALPGKALGHQWADVIAWGCVLTEVKSSKPSYRTSNPQFHFAFTHDQQRNGIRGSIVVLVCKYEDQYDYHLFPASHPAFYKEGRIRSHITYTPNRSKIGKPSVLTEDMMNMAKDDWTLVEQYKQQAVAKLLAGATMATLLKAG